eukprot:9481058-Pyramimonas_sp.AAC.1
MTPRAPGRAQNDLQDGSKYPKMSHNGFLCVLPTSLIEALPLDIVSGWAGGDSRNVNNYVFNCCFAYEQTVLQSVEQELPLQSATGGMFFVFDHKEKPS